MILWQLGFPNATLSDLEHLLKEGREIGHAASLMGALFYASLLDVWCKGHHAERKLTEELLALAEEKHAPFFAALGTMQRGVVLAVTGDAEAAVPALRNGEVLARQNPRFLSLAPSSGKCFRIARVN